MEHWIEKKFTAAKKVARRDDILPNANWQHVLFCAELRHPPEITLMKERGVKVVRYNDVIADLLNEASVVNSNAGNILEILRYTTKNQQGGA